MSPPYGGDIKMGGNFSSILTQGGRPFLVVGDYGSAEFWRLITRKRFHCYFTQAQGHTRTSTGSHTLPVFSIYSTCLVSVDLPSRSDCFPGVTCPWIIYQAHLCISRSVLRSDYLSGGTKCRGATDLGLRHCHWHRGLSTEWLSFCTAVSTWTHRISSYAANQRGIQKYISLITVVLQHLMILCSSSNLNRNSK